MNAKVSQKPEIVISFCFILQSGFAFGADTMLNFVLFTKSHNNWLNNKRGLRMYSYVTRMYPYVCRSARVVF